MDVLAIIGINIIIIILIFLYLNRKIEKRIEPAAILKKIEDEINEIILELNQTTDRNIGLIEDRIKVLREVLEKADKRINLIKKEAEKSEFSTTLYNNILKKARTENNIQEERKGYKVTDQEKIIDLHRKGISANIIAKRVGTTVGEVELVISLDNGKR